MKSVSIAPDTLIALTLPPYLYIQLILDMVMIIYIICEIDAMRFTPQQEQKFLSDFNSLATQQ